MSKLLVPAFILTFIFLASSSFAAGADVSISSGSIDVYAGETQTIDVIVKNTLSASDTFTLSMFPSQFEKVSTSLESFLITLEPNEERTLRLYVTAAIDSDLLSPSFTITSRSVSDESLSDSENLIVIVKRQTPVYILALSLERYSLNPSDEVKITTKIFNLEGTLSDKYFLKIAVKKGTSIVNTFDESLDSIGARSSVDISKGFKLDKYAQPGSYVVEAELRDENNQLKYAKSINFNVDQVTKQPTEYIHKSSGYNIIFSSKTIKVINEGNVELQAFTLTESLPKFAQSLFDPDIEPTTTDSSSDRIVYSWSVPSLPPGGEYTISYKLALWRVWLTAGVIGIVGYFAYKWISKPVIGKRASHEGELKRGKEILVMIEAKNRALHEIKDVEVIDVVPHIARVVDRFDTLRPKIKRVPDGIEMRWNLGSLRPGEERVLTYRIKPAVDIIGHLNLPETQMIFVDRHKTKRMSVSKQTLVRAT